MIDPELLKILRCPETHQELALATPDTVQALNDRIAARQLQNRAGKPVTAKLDGGLLRGDGRVLYPVRQKIPVLLIDEGIPLSVEPSDQ
jgi:uncharacterized protein